MYPLQWIKWGKTMKSNIHKSKNKSNAFEKKPLKVMTSLVGAACKTRYTLQNALDQFLQIKEVIFKLMINICSERRNHICSVQVRGVCRAFETSPVVRTEKRLMMMSSGPFVYFSGVERQKKYNREGWVSQRRARHSLFKTIHVSESSQILPSTPLLCSSLHTIWVSGHDFLNILFEKTTFTILHLVCPAT